MTLTVMRSPCHILSLHEFFHPDICASAVVATDQLTKLAALRPDWRITVLAGNRAWDDPAKVHPATEDYRGLKIIRVKRPAVRKNLLSRGLGFAILHRNLVRAAKQIGEVNLVIGTTAPPQGGCLAAEIAKRKRCPFIYKVLDLYPDVAVTIGRIREGGLVHRRWLRRDAASMNRAAAVVAISSPMIERIARLRGIDRAKLYTVHDGFDAGRLNAARLGELNTTHPTGSRTDFNPDGKFVVQYAGNMGLSHPFETILGAARQMTESDKDVLFQFVGEGLGRAKLEESRSENVRLIPFQPAERLGEVLGAADVGLISQHEQMYDQAMPYKIYGLLAAGKPCIFLGNQQSEIAEWLRDAACGYVVRQDDVGGLVRAIQELRSPEVRERLGWAARRLFGERFDSARAAQAWHDLMSRILEHVEA